MTSFVMLQLGDFQFSVDTAAYERLRRTDVFRWVPQDPVSAPTSLQAQSLGLSKISLEGVIFTTYDRSGVPVGTYQLDRIRALAGRMQPLVLTDGRGNVYDLWCVDLLEVGESTFFGNGAARKQEFTINLTKFGGNINGAGFGILTDTLWNFL